MEVIELDRRAALGMAALIDRTSIEEFNSPTPCPEWTVGDLLGHILAGNVKYLHIAQGSDWGRGVPDVGLDDDPARAYRRGIETMLHAWQQPGVLAREVTLPIGRGPAEAALFIHLGETLVHGWDLANATRQRPPWGDAVVKASLTQFRSWLPPQRPPGTPFSDAISLVDDAKPIDRLAAYLGRDVAAWST